MKLSELNKRVPDKKRKRLGRGDASGKGGTSGRGHKGQKARTGKKIKVGFEGGQMPLMRRIPKRGFTNAMGKNYQVINLSALGKFNKDEEINPEVLKEKNLISKGNKLVKILGEGELNKPLNITAHAFSKSAKEKIERAGGKITILKVMR